MSDQGTPLHGRGYGCGLVPESSHPAPDWPVAAEPCHPNLAPVTASTRPPEAKPEHGRRVEGLDGLRGLAAVYVVLFHCWLYALPGFPDNGGPSWLGWLSYGRIAVVFFLVLSGFSLAVGPAGDRWGLGGVARFLRRRAWRILPPYWAALAASLAVAYLVVPASHSGPPTGRTVVVYGFALQDVLAAPTPNGAFWSIAVEIELYLLFPLLLAIRRRLGVVILAAATVGPVVAYGVLSPNSLPMEDLNWLTPHLLPVFAAGMVGAGIVAARDWVRRLPWHWLAALAAVPVVALVLRNGTAWAVDRFFWLDLAVLPAMVMLVAAVATGRPGLLLRLLSSWPLRRLGDISYSLYLTHLMIVIIMARRLAPEFLPPGMERFWFTLLLGFPLSLLVAALFAVVFEIPFKRARSWKSLFASGHLQRLLAGAREQRRGVPRDLRVRPGR